MDTPRHEPRHFLAATGAAGYDSIWFSGEPQAELVSHIDSPIQAVRHLGISGPAQAHACGRLAEVDILLVNLSASARLRGRIGDVPVDKLLQRGHVSFIPHDCPADVDFPAAHTALQLFIPQADFRRVANDLGAGEVHPIVSARHDRLAQLIAMVAAELSMPGFASDLMVDGLIRAIGAALAQHDASPLHADYERIHLSPVRLARVVDFVEAKLDGEIHLADLAEIAGLSLLHFTRVFKLATGETPYHFVGSRRLERARSMLLGSDMPLAELALSCGFASQSHFTAAFSNAMGVPPGRYRRLRGEQGAPVHRDKAICR